MIDINIIRQQPDLIKKNNLIRKCRVSVDEVLSVDARRRELIKQIDSLREERNQTSHVGGKITEADRERVKEVKKTIKDLTPELARIEEELNQLLIQLPNLTHESVPTGEDESANVVYKKWSLQDPEQGKVAAPTFAVKPHWEIGSSLDLIDIDRGSKVAGSRFWYIKNELVHLEFALVQYALGQMRRHGFVPMLPPMIVRERAMYGTGFFPADEREIYRLSNPEEFGTDEKTPNADQYLIGTAEVPLAAYHMDEILNLDQPLKYGGFSSCFRREAGTYGKDMQGILRGHQFDKIELFIFASAADSWAMHEHLLTVAEEFWQWLEIPYQVLLMCSGDIGAPNAKKYDVEAWMPGQGRYREIVSCSNDTDFQARRLNIKYLDPAGERQFCHTLNSTLVAIGRALIAIMENYQTPDGTIIIPQVLKPYMFGIEEIKRYGTT